jgi:hypothetical protein
VRGEAAGWYGAVQGVVKQRSQVKKMFTIVSTLEAYGGHVRDMHGSGVVRQLVSVRRLNLDVRDTACGGALGLEHLASCAVEISTRSDPASALRLRLTRTQTDLRILLTNRQLVWSCSRLAKIGATLGLGSRDSGMWRAKWLRTCRTCTKYTVLIAPFHHSRIDITTIKTVAYFVQAAARYPSKIRLEVIPP